MNHEGPSSSVDAEDTVSQALVLIEFRISNGNV